MRMSSSLNSFDISRLTIPRADVNDHALALALTFAITVVAFQLVQQIPSRVVRSESVRVAKADSGIAASAKHGKKVKVRGLAFMPPGVKARTAGSELDARRDAGLLRGYSVPPNRLAFTPGAQAVFLPAPPVPGKPVAARSVFNGNRARKKVALTFDTSDVSEKSHPMAILDELTRLRAPATFFVCGAWCHKNLEVLRAMLDRGFEVANHSYNHPMFTKLTNEQITAQLKGTEEAVMKVAGAKIAAYFRPPYGDTDARVEQVAADSGYITVIWDKDTLDWRADTIRENIRDRATLDVRGGDIVLMHTLGGHTRDAIVEVTGNIRAQGFELTTVSGVLVQ